MSEELYSTLTAEQTVNATIAIAKGDKGDKGDAYIITEADKKEIKESLSGDINEIKSDLNDLTKVDVTWTKGYRLADGIQVIGDDWYITDYIELKEVFIYDK